MDKRNIRASLLCTAAAALGAAAIASFALGGAAFAANPPAPASASAPAKAPADSAAATNSPAGASADKDKGKKNAVPEDVIKGLVAGTPEGLEKVKKYLAGEKFDTQATTDRAIALVTAVRNTPDGQDPQKLLALSQKVTDQAKSLFQGSTITKVTVDKNFHPLAGDKAWKFGPRDADPPSGFEMVTVDDRRLKGVDMKGIHRPGTDPLMETGIEGVRNFQDALPNGQWRVIMITDDLGQPETAKAPFGSQVEVNNTHVALAEEDPTHWLERSYLTNKDLKPGGGGGGAGGTAEGANGLGVTTGVVAHQAAPPGGGGSLAKGDVGSTSAGALTLQTSVNEQHLGVGWLPPKSGGQETYIVAIIAEPADRPPLLTPATSTLDMEGKIFNQAVNLTQPPKSGEPVLPTPPGGPQPPQPPGTPQPPQPPQPPQQPSTPQVACATCSASNH
jgi:hypothetical protein